MTTTAIIVALVVLIVGLWIVFGNDWEDYSRPFFQFDEEQARKDVEELLKGANK